MAVRRISDLPELYSNYADASLGKCLIEVSYNSENNVYLSFYTNLSTVTDLIIKDVNDHLEIPETPYASKSEYGIVKIGDNIDVANGVISVPIANNGSVGVIKGCATSTYVGFNSATGQLTIAATPSGDGSTITSKLIIDIAYPIGSLWFTAKASNLTPPGYGEDGITWDRLGGDRSLWITSFDPNQKSTDSNLVGINILGSLPSPTLECELSGDHTHSMLLNVLTGSADSTALNSLATYVRSVSFTKLSESDNAIAGKPYYDEMLSIVKLFPSDGVVIYAFRDDGTQTSTKYATITNEALLRDLLIDKRINSRNVTATSIRLSFAKHNSEFWRYTNTNINNAGEYAAYLDNLETANSNMAVAGAHTHNIKAKEGSSIYRSTTSYPDLTTVRPTSIGVAVWVRIS